MFICLYTRWCLLYKLDSYKIFLKLSYFKSQLDQIQFTALQATNASNIYYSKNYLKNQNYLRHVD